MARSDILCLFFITLLASTVRVSHALWPAPHSYQYGKAVLPLASSFDIVLKGSLASKAGSDLKAAVTAAKGQVYSDNLGPLVVDRGASYRTAVTAAKTQLTSLQVALKASSSCKHQTTKIADEVNKLIETRDESYTLSIPDGSVATLSACTALGLYRGLQTFTQLVYTLPSNSTRYIPNTPVRIDDKPAFPIRGIMLDTARNFYPVDEIKRHIDAASWAKFNTLHWYDLFRLLF
jgi:hexosaminidase